MYFIYLQFKWFWFNGFFTVDNKEIASHASHHLIVRVKEIQYTLYTVFVLWGSNVVSPIYPLLKGVLIRSIVHAHMFE